MHQNGRTAGIIPARDLKLLFFASVVAICLINVGGNCQAEIYIQYSLNIIHSSEMPQNSLYTWQYPNIYIHELVVRAWQLASVTQLVTELHWNCRATGLIPARNLSCIFLLYLPISYVWQYPSIHIHKLVVRGRQMASVAQSTASESQACRFNSCQGRDLKLHFFLVTKVFRNKCTVYKFPLDNFHLQYPSNIIHLSEMPQNLYTVNLRL